MKHTQSCLTKKKETVMSTRMALVIALSSSFLLASCATAPMGPTVQVMPNPNKPFQNFQQDQESCKQYAQAQVAGQADAANKNAIGAAALGTLLGAGLGAAVGNNQGAGVGAATGMIAGTSVGAGSSQNAQMSIQTQYDNAYTQCMYSKGNQVPGAMPSEDGSIPPPGSMPPPPSGSMHPPHPRSAQGGGSGMSVADAQVALNALGYPVGKADGSMGPHTRSQLKRFQKSRGLPETGELDPPTVAALNQ
jgi:uncharacterized protein YcfJ